MILGDVVFIFLQPGGWRCCLTYVGPVLSVGTLAYFGLAMCRVVVGGGSRVVVGDQLG